MVNDVPSEPAATNVPLKTKATFGLHACFEWPFPWLSVVVADVEVEVELSLLLPCPSSASANEAPAPATNSARAIAFSFMRLKMPRGWHSCHPPGEDHPLEALATSSRRRRRPLRAAPSPSRLPPGSRPP